MPPAPVYSVKYKAEQSVINLLNRDSTLAALTPRQQVADAHDDTNPRIAVVATVGKEVEVGANIFYIQVAIEIYCNIPQSGQQSAQLEDYGQRVNAVLDTAQAAENIGIILNGDVTNLNGLVGKRTISVTIIGG